MSFGFPAYHETTLTKIPPGTDLKRSIGSALSRMGWNPKAQDNTFEASTTLSMSSFGEKFIVQILPNGSVRVRSQCKLFTQCFDWGKNKRNVERFMEELPRHYVASGSLGSLR